MIDRRIFICQLPLAASVAWGFQQSICEPSTGSLTIAHFDKYKVSQGPNQCWAACIQMFLNYSKIQWSQQNVAQLVKTGHDVVLERAQSQEIGKRLQGRFVDGLGEGWTFDCLHIDGAPPEVIYGYLCGQRPIVAGLESDHVVVIHAADFVQMHGKKVPSRPRNLLHVSSLTYYDPGTGEDMEIAESHLSRIREMWLFTAMSNKDKPF